MAEYAGNVTYISFRGVALSQDYRKLSTEETVDFKDASAGSDAYKPKVATQKDGTASVDLLCQSGTSGTAVWAAVAPNYQGTLTWAPEGTATGAPKFDVVAFVTKRTRDMPYDDVVSMSIDFEFNGVVGESTY